ncbi:MAG: intradiol ring-cleavage dioxygenase [Planctomycetes bacterium]|nr:intradiol ring-cleavage dioxygenase [Planctomycetota bacterium]
MSFQIAWTRRAFLNRCAFGAALFATPGLFAEELTRTPPQTEGPFYPDRLPLDTDNDLLMINDGITPAVGQVTHLGGRILDARGNPIRGAVVEVWQVDNKGSYLHSDGDGGQGRDGNFQGFGRFLTGRTGEYYFRTIKPVPYTFRTPHIHFAVKIKGREEFTTQCYVKGEPLNQQDRIFQSVREPAAREALLVDFKPLKESKIGELTANFDIVLGFTPKG